MSSDTEYDQARVPPQDPVAEEYVLGAILLADRAIETAVEVCAPQDFYRLSHGLIFQACLDLYNRGEPIDALMLCDALDKKSQLESIGGRSRIHELAALVPASANIGHYARIVHEMSTLRGLIKAGQEIASLGYDRPGEVAELVDRAEEAVFALSTGRTGGFSDANEILTEAFKRITARYEAGADLVGTATGYRDFDRLTSGFEPGNLIVVAARPAMGKGLRMDAKVLTPSGWRLNGNLRVGDKVIGADGKPDTVTGVFDRGVLDFYRVMFADGAQVECSGDHLWLTRTRQERRREQVGEVRDTAEIARTVKRTDAAGANHSVPFMETAQFEQRHGLLADPYWLGLYLGDGHSWGNVMFTNPEPDLIGAFVSALPAGDVGVVVNDGRCPAVRVKRSVRDNQVSDSLWLLRDLGLAGLRSHEKFIPEEYLLASAADRLSLLQGICDSDGYVTTPGRRSIEVSTASRDLCEGIMFLVGSLGGRANYCVRETSYKKDGERHEAKTAYRIVLSFPSGEIVPVRSEKHLAQWKHGPHTRSRERFISSIEPAGRHECRCITVSRELYVTDGFVVTHNSAFSFGMAANLSVKQGIPVGIFSYEMSKQEIAGRLLCAEAHVDSQRLRTGKVAPEEWPRLTRACGSLEAAPLFVDDSPGTCAEIRSKARALKAKHPDLGLVIVDYLQLMAGGASVEHRVQEVSQISRNLKLIARDLEVPLVAISQLSRAVEQRGDKKPILSDLRESGSIEQDADLVVFLYRDEYYHEDSDQKGLCDVIVAKHRNGPTDTVKLAWLKHYAQFSDLASV